MTQRIGKKISQLGVSAAVLSLIAGLYQSQRVAAATITTAPGYSVSLFASNPAGASQPDSITIGGNYIYVGYGNGTKSNGSDNLPTTIAQYTTGGQLVKTFSVPGHNDGLRFNPTTNQLFALQNQDGNPNFAVINPITGAEQTYTLNSINGGGGYDDLAFLNGQIYIDAANPNIGDNPVNTLPVLGTLSINGNTATVTPVLSSGNGFNLTDPDSLGTTSDGNLTIDGEGDKALYTVTNLGTSQVSVLPHPTFTADDNVFGPTTPSTLLVADTSGGIVYQISGSFTPGAPYISASDGNAVGTLNADGSLTPIVSGLGSPHGLGFLQQPVPEPSSVLGLLSLGLLVSVRLKRFSR